VDPVPANRRDGSGRIRRNSNLTQPGSPGVMNDPGCFHIGANDPLDTPTSRRAVTPPPAVRVFSSSLKKFPATTPKIPCSVAYERGAAGSPPEAGAASTRRPADDASAPRV